MTEWGILEINGAGEHVVWFGTAPDRQAAMDKYVNLAAEREGKPREHIEEQIGDLWQWVEETPSSLTWAQDEWTLVIFQMSGEVVARPL
jgi:hypothetical protein